MIVIDASAALVGLLNDGTARRLLGAQQLHAPDLIDVEVASGLRRHVRSGQLEARVAEQMLAGWAQLGVVFHASRPHLGRVWTLRDNLSAYDALYVALAEQLGVELVTADAKIAGAPGVGCPVTVVPR